MPGPKYPRKPDDPEQYRRFVEVARELGVDENDPEAMNRAFDKVVRSRTPTKKPTDKPKS